MKWIALVVFLLALSCGGSGAVEEPNCSCSPDLCGCPAEACQCQAAICDCPALPVRAIGSIETDGTLLGLSGTLPVTSVQRLGVGRYWIGVDAEPATAVQLTPRNTVALINYNLFWDGVLIEAIDLSGQNVDCEFSFAIEQTAQMVP